MRRWGVSILAALLVAGGVGVDGASASVAGERSVGPSTLATAARVQGDGAGPTGPGSWGPDGASASATFVQTSDQAGRSEDRFPAFVEVPGSELSAGISASSQEGTSFFPLADAVGTVTGTVRGPGNALALGGCVRLFSYDGTYVQDLAGGCVDGSGSFSFAAPPGTYRLLYEGFVDGSGNPLIDEWYADAATVQSAGSVVLSGGATIVRSAVLGAGQDIRFYTGSYYGGCVTAYNSSGGMATQHCGTGTGLNYIGLPPDAYVFYFSGYTSSFGDLIDSWYAGGYTAYVPEDAVWVELYAGQERDVNPFLRLALHTIDGTVTLPDGAEMDGWVGVYQGALSGPLLDWVAVNPDGTYQITGLPLGEDKAVVFADFTGAADEWGRPTAFPGQGAPSWGTALKWATTDQSEVVNADLEVEGTIAGDLIVPDDFTSGTACVRAFDPLYAYGEWRGYYVGGYCGAVGEPFVIHHLRSWDYRLEFVDPGASSAADAWYRAKPSLDLADDVSVVEGAMTTIAPVWDVPTVGSVAPGYGPQVGGTSVTITGSGFLTVTEVTFGGVAGTGLSVLSDTSLTVTTPAGAAVRAPIVVTNAAGDSLPAAAAFFAFLDSSVVAGSPARVEDVSGFTSGVVRCYPVAGRTGVPVGATGVLLNVTAVGPSGNGYVVVYPDTAGNGATVAPLASTVNFEPGRDVANSAMVALPSDGKVCAYSAGGTLSRLILDVAGYLVPGSGITMQSAQRLLDTRQTGQQVTGPVAPMVVNTVQVTGNAGVPTGATAVVANVTVTGVTDGGHLRVWASGAPLPNTSVVNYAPGQTKANGQIIALSAGGALDFESFTGAGTATNPVQVIIDVVGYVSAGSQFIPTDPTRIVETRASEGVVGPIPGALVPNTVYPVELTDATLIPSTATAVVLNVTAVGPTAFGNLRVYPDTNGLGTTAPPLASVLNYIPGRAIPNMVIVQIPPDRIIDFYNDMGLTTDRTHLIVDVIGYINAATT